MYPENSICYRNLSTDERNKLWQNLIWQLKPLYYFANCMPVRVSELVCITRERIHLDTRSIDLPMGTVKNGRVRVLIIPEEFVPYVRWMLSTPAKYLFNRGVEHDYAPIGFGVFPKDTITVRKFEEQSAFRKAMKLSGLTDYNFHKTRQEAILNLAQEGWELEAIRLVGGWETLEAFERYLNKDLYLHIKQGTYKVDLTWKTRFAVDLIPETNQDSGNIVQFPAAGTTSGDNESLLLDTARKTKAL